MKGRMKKLLALCLGAAITLSSVNVLTVKADGCSGVTGEEIFAPEEGDIIPCYILNWLVRDRLGIAKEYRKLTPADLVGIDDLTYEDGSHPEAYDFDSKMYSIYGLEYGYDLKTLLLSYNAITDLSPLKDLKKLETLIMKQNSDKNGNNKLKDISPIANITTLKDVGFDGNAVEDISALTNLTNIEILSLSNNPNIKNIEPLKNLTKIHKLMLTNCGITDISSLSKLTKMEELLWLGKNQISDISALKDMKSLKGLLLEENQITDLTPLAGLTSLTELNLSGNTNITDYGPLTGLINLPKDKLYLNRTGIENQKDELYQVIDTNKLLNQFHANTITVSDKANVEAARTAYDALSVKQKSYIKENRLTCAEANLALAEAGKEIVQYPDLDDSVVENVVMRELNVKVVDTDGNPVPNVKFALKTQYRSEDMYSDTKGILTYKTSVLDAYSKFTLAIAEDSGYTSDIADIKFVLSGVFSVDIGQATKIITINGKPVTGKENLVFTLTKTGADVIDRTALQLKLTAAKSILADGYTTDSYEALQKEIKAAEIVYNNESATKKDLDKAVADLQAKIDALVKEAAKTKVFKAKAVDKDGNALQGVKFNVKAFGTNYDTWTDKNGQISYSIPNYSYGNTYTCKVAEEGYTSNPESMAIETSGTEMDCYISKINGTVYDGSVLTFKLTTGEAETVDKTALKEKLDAAEAIKADGYTTESYEALQTEITAAKAVFENADATKEDVEKAVTGLQAKIDALVKEAAKIKVFKAKAVDKDGNALQGVKFNVKAFGTNYDTWTDKNGQISYNIPNYSYGNTYTCKVAAEGYTSNPESMAIETAGADTDCYITKINGTVYDGSVLTFKLTTGEAEAVDKTALKEKLDAAEAIKADGYTTESYEALQTTIAAAKAVFENADATKEDVEKAVTGLQAKIDALVTETAQTRTFKAKAIDADGNPISGVIFEVKANGTYQKMTSNDAGLMDVTISANSFGNTYTCVLMADQQYTSNPANMKIETAGPMGDSYISKVDGKDYNGEVLVFTLTVKDGEIVDKSALKIVLAEAKGFKAEEYTQESFQALQTAITDADAVFSNANAKTAEVEAATADLREKIKALVKITEDTVDKSVLKASIDAAKAIKAEAYTQESFQALQIAITAAEEVYNASDVEQSMVDKAAADLKAAVDGLIKKETPLPTPDTNQNGQDSNVVIKPAGQTAAKTGDTVSPFVWVLLIGASGIVLGRNMKKSKKNGVNE